MLTVQGFKWKTQPTEQLECARQSLITDLLPKTPLTVAFFGEFNMV